MGKLKSTNLFRFIDYLPFRERFGVFATRALKDAFAKMGKDDFADDILNNFLWLGTHLSHDGRFPIHYPSISKVEDM